MINFFRKIRHKLADDNKFLKYSRYAIGEIALVMIGILLALQLNNWNEERKLEAQFKVSLEKLYNSINFDQYLFQNSIDLLEWQIHSIDFLLLHPDSIPLDQIPWAIYGLGFEPNEGVSPETIYHTSFLENSISNNDQNDLSKQIINYVNYARQSKKRSFDLIYPIFLEEEVPFPNPSISLETNFYTFADTISYYSMDEFNRLKSVFDSHKFKSTIKSLRSTKIMDRVIPKNQLEDANSILQLIKVYYPEVRLVYQYVGIIGTSIDGFPDVGAKSTPLAKNKEDENIWEIEMFLKQGKVKFRCRDSWAQNWGGSSFPTGSAEFDGLDILVDKAGDYLIRLDLGKKTYEFIKKEDES